MADLNLAERKRTQSGKWQSKKSRHENDRTENGRPELSSTKHDTLIKQVH